MSNVDADLPPAPWRFEMCSGRVRDANGNCILQIFGSDDHSYDALVQAIMRTAPPAVGAKHAPFPPEGDSTNE